MRRLRTVGNGFGVALVLLAAIAVVVLSCIGYGGVELPYPGDAGF